MRAEQAIETIETMWKDYPLADAEKEALNMAIGALEQSQWIPISKEPDTANHVLVTAKWKEDDYEVFEIDYWVEKYEAEHGNERCKNIIEHITAWRYMPEPWKGDKE